MPAPYTLPTPGSDPFDALRVRYARHTLRRLLDWPTSLPPWMQLPYARVREALATVMGQSSPPLLASLCLPVVGAPLHSPETRAGAALAEAMPHLLLELARRRILPREGVFWDVPVSRLLSPPLGWGLHPVRPISGSWFGNGEISLRLPGGLTREIDLQAPLAKPPGAGDVSPDFLRLEEGGWFCLHDNNPLSSLEAHPHKGGNALDLGDASSSRWVDSLNEARALLGQGLPELAAEHRRLLAQVVPVGTPGEISLSASYREAIGMVYVSWHPRALTLTEALIHETQHNKLNLMSHLDPLLEEGNSVYTSPVRPDPRPLWGVLLAVHAFLPVISLYQSLRRQNHPHALTAASRQRHEEILKGNHQGMEILRTASRPVGMGVALIEGMDSLERSQWEEGREK